ncbi:MAG: double-cubane-cluster-containing anaerobic reductase [Atopobiaceae bacterium]|jgi:benzoyl-CoA reductase/2-hydroxyglutaryl-CoA dehydratase subunit BcrC/BadD/HgdB
MSTATLPNSTTAIPTPLDLPSTFEEYNEARKQGFMRVHDFKKAGGKLVGTLCTYAPAEVIEAAGAACVGLCGTSDEPIDAAETVLPKNLCPLIKSTYGFALTDKCPYTYFSDLIVGETTCDGKKKMYELLGEIRPTYVLHLPNGQLKDHEKDSWYQEVVLLKEKLEQIYGVKITDDDLRQAVHNRNLYRKALLALFELQRTDPCPMSSVEFMSTLQSGTFAMDVVAQAEKIQELVATRRKEAESGAAAQRTGAKRIVLSGCPAGGLINKVGKTIDDNGGVIVCLDSCMGERTNSMMINEDAPNILRAISDRYLQINCSVMTPNSGRFDNTLHMVEKYHADGVVDAVLQACHTFNLESITLGRVLEDHGIPYMKLETDYSAGDQGQVSTRLSAFIEMI